LLLVLQKTSSRYTINGKSIPSLSVFIIILSHIVTSIGVVLSAMAGSHLGDFFNKSSIAHFTISFLHCNIDILFTFPFLVIVY
jgi:hypothetical protein